MSEPRQHLENRVIRHVFRQPSRLPQLLEKIQDARLFQHRLPRLYWQVFELIHSEGRALDLDAVKEVLIRTRHQELIDPFQELISGEDPGEEDWRRSLSRLIEGYRKQELLRVSATIREKIDSLSSDELLSEINCDLLALNVTALGEVTFGKCPQRSPRIVAETIRDVIADKVVCDLGCGEGDNMLFLSKYARKVVGMNLPAGRPGELFRIGIAIARGFEVVVGDYRRDPLPAADVYYYWPQHGDYEQLIDRFRSEPDLQGILVLPADSGYPRETEEVRRLADVCGGTIREIAFDEGSGYRESGLVTLAILDSATFC